MPRPTRRKTRLDTWLASASTPVYVLDDRRRLVFFNQGCEELTGWSWDEIVGQVCEYSSGGEDEGDGHTGRLTRRLCPPPEVLSGLPQTIPVELEHRDGTSLPRLLNFIPLLHDDADVRRVLAFIIPIDPPDPPGPATPAQ